nr:hypothetical protein [Bradyrhizobium sp. AC87j1]
MQNGFIESLRRWLRPASRSDAGAPITILHHNTHLSMWLKQRDFADRDAIPWGILDFGARVL